MESGFHWFRTTTSCLRKPRSVLHFTFLSCLHLQHRFLRILADPNSTDLLISSMDVSTTMVLRFSFNFQSFEASNRGQFSCRCTLDLWLDLIGVISS